MKRLIMMLMVLVAMGSTTEVSAQSFLKKLGKKIEETAKRKVENKVERTTEKAVRRTEVWNLSSSESRAKFAIHHRVHRVPQSINLPADEKE